MTELVFYTKEGVAEGGYVFYDDNDLQNAVADAAEETLMLLNVDEDDDPESYAVDRALIINDAMLALGQGDTYKDKAGYTWKVENNG